MWVAEFARDELTERQLAVEVTAALRAVKGVVDVRREDREVWLVAGKPNGKALVSAAAALVDRLGPLILPESD